MNQSNNKTTIKFNKNKSMHSTMHTLNLLEIISLLFVIILIVLCLYKPASHTTLNTTSANTISYARIKDTNSYLYKSATNSESVDNKFFKLPPTFFVKILNNFNEIFYKAEYDGIIGYVKKENVNLVNETPTKPYATTRTVTIKTGISCFMREQPKIKTALSNVITTLTNSTTNIKYLGQILGDDAIDMQGNIWYYVKVNNMYGYIYSYYVNEKLLDEINTEKVSIKQTYQNLQLTPLGNTQSMVLIAIIMLPLMFIMYLMYKPYTYKAKVKKVKHITQINISKDIDYYNDRNPK